MALNLPRPGAGFEWDERGPAPVLRCATLSTAVRHGFTTRQLRLRGGDPDGWTRAAAVVACPADALHRVRQVHGAAVHVVNGTAPIAEPPEADALITRTPGTALAVVTADCVPILLADPDSGAVGAVHAGWRGTAADVGGAAVRRLADEWGVSPHRLIAAIGPSIGACCYEVGDELVAAFAAAGYATPAPWFARDANRRWRLDLWAANRDLLVRAGVPAGQIFVAGLCTKTHVAWFDSYRAEGAGAGRLAAIVVAGEPRPGANHDERT